MSYQNNVGSVPSVDYHNYDYDSHHAQPFGPGDGHGNGSGNGNGGDNGDDNGRHSPINKYCDEPQPEKKISLGYGTESIKKSKRKHKAYITAKLKAIGIDQALEQNPSHVEAEQAAGGQTDGGQGNAGQGRAG